MCEFDFDDVLDNVLDQDMDENVEYNADDDGNDMNEEKADKNNSLGAIYEENDQKSNALHMNMNSVSHSH